jgi:hypothetical protein
MDTEIELASAIEKYKYLNRLNEEYGTICSLIYPELLLQISSFKTPMKFIPPWKEFLANRMRRGDIYLRWNYHFGSKNLLQSPRFFYQL